MKLSIAVALLGGTAVWAADPTPMNIKTGEWEYTVTMQMTVLPQQAGKQMPSIPPETLAKLPPDQRAKMEAMLKQATDISNGKPTTTTNKDCVKPEDLAKLNPSRNTDKSCKLTMLSSSRTKQEMKMDCDSDGSTTTSNMTIEAANPESIKFTMVSTGHTNGKPMGVNVNGVGKWLSASCTETK